MRLIGAKSPLHYVQPFEGDGVPPEPPMANDSYRILDMRWGA